MEKLINNMAKKRNYKHGGKMDGPSHSKGGIPINVEGGEYVIKVFCQQRYRGLFGIYQYTW